MKHGRYDMRNIQDNPNERTRDGELWSADSACASLDPDIFFPEEIADPQVRAQSIAKAKRACGDCSVRLICLQRAIDNGDDFGIFGGLDARERDALRERRKDSHEETAAVSA